MFIFIWFISLFGLLFIIITFRILFIKLKNMNIKQRENKKYALSYVLTRAYKPNYENIKH